MTNNNTEPEMPAQNEEATAAENHEAAKVAFDPKDKKYQYDYGNAIDLANVSSHEEAIPYIDELFNRYKEMPAGDKSYLYYLKAISLHYSKQDYPEALRHYDLAINSVPNPEGICYYDRGLLKHKLGDKEGRDEDFAIFVRLRPDIAYLVDEIEE